MIVYNIDSYKAIAVARYFMIQRAENMIVHNIDSYKDITVARYPVKIGTAYLLTLIVSLFLSTGPILYGGSYGVEAFVLFTVPSQQKC